MTFIPSASLDPLTALGLNRKNRQRFLSPEMIAGIPIRAIRAEKHFAPDRTSFGHALEAFVGMELYKQLSWSQHRFEQIVPVNGPCYSGPGSGGAESRPHQGVPA